MKSRAWVKSYFSQVGGTLVSVLVCVCVVYGSVTLGTWGEVEHTQLRVSPDWLCHLLISCHGELVGPSLLEMCPWEPAALPRWACGGFVCRGSVYVCACVCVSPARCVWLSVCDPSNSHSRFLFLLFFFLKLSEHLHSFLSRLICNI